MSGFHVAIALIIVAILSLFTYAFTKIFFKKNRSIWFWIFLAIVWRIVSALYLKFGGDNSNLSYFFLLPMFAINCIIYFACIIGLLVFLIRKAISGDEANS